MPTAPVNDLELDYATLGDPEAPAVLFIMGLGAHRTWWRQELLDAVVDAGYHAVTFDNRDVGASTVLHDAPGSLQDVMNAYARQPYETAYGMSDLAADAIGLLDHLSIDRAHVVGASMGGMIAQTVAVEHPSRVVSLTSIMSTTGAPGTGQPTPEAGAALLKARPTDRDGYIEISLETAKVIGTPSMLDEEEIRHQAAETWERGYHPGGVVRQLLAILSQPDRTPALRQLDVPTLVIHGASDPLVQPDGGEATAAAIPGARLELIEGMGHDFPPPLRAHIGALLVDHLRAADGPATPVFD